MRKEGLIGVLVHQYQKNELEQAIEASGGSYLPNDTLPALDPSDVVVLADGSFWINENWQLQPFLATEQEEVASIE